jgi:prepilin-type N-terminal cleavage/methylation domain-containing protein
MRQTPRCHCMGASAASERGVTLIEVLVAVVLLSIGLLGLAGLQLRGMQVNQGSAMRSQAAIMADDLADRMRSDYANVPAYYGGFTPLAGTAPASLKDWLTSLQSLPAGAPVASITDACSGATLPCVAITALAQPTGAPPTPVEIHVYWNDTRAATAATAAIAIPGFAAPPVIALGEYKTVTELSEQF